MEDFLHELLIGIVATAVVSATLFVCSILYKLITKWRQSHDARGSGARLRAPTSPDADSGEQRLPQGDALHDMEMGPTNSAEVTNVSDSSSPDGGNAAEEYMEMTSHTANTWNSLQPYSGLAFPR